MPDPTDIREQIAAFLAGDLDADAAARLQDRIDSEPWLAREADRVADGMLSLGAVDEVEPPPGFHDRMVARLAQEVGYVEGAVGAGEDGPSRTSAAAAGTGWAGRAREDQRAHSAGPRAAAAQDHRRRRRGAGGAAGGSGASGQRRRAALGAVAAIAVLFIGSVAVLSGTSSNDAADTAADAVASREFDQADSSFSEDGVAPDEAAADAVDAGSADAATTAEAPVADALTAIEAGEESADSALAVPDAGGAGGASGQVDPAGPAPLPGGGGAADPGGDNAADDASPAGSAPQDTSPQDTSPQDPAAGQADPADGQAAAAPEQDASGQAEPVQDAPPADEQPAASQPAPAAPPTEDQGADATATGPSDGDTAGPTILDLGESTANSAVQVLRSSDGVQGLLGDPVDGARADAYRDEVLRAPDHADGTPAGSCLTDVLSQAGPDAIVGATARHVEGDTVFVDHALLRPSNGDVWDTIDVWVIDVSGCVVVAVMSG